MMGIPDRFYDILADELIRVFGNDAFDEVDDGLGGGCNNIYRYVSTPEFSEAFDIACDKAGIPWLREQCDDLMWYDEVAFGYEVVDDLLLRRAA